MRKLAIKTRLVYGFRGINDLQELVLKNLVNLDVFENLSDNRVSSKLPEPNSLIFPILEVLFFFPPNK